MIKPVTEYINATLELKGLKNKSGHRRPAQPHLQSKLQLEVMLKRELGSAEGPDRTGRERPSLRAPGEGCCRNLLPEIKNLPAELIVC